MVRSTLLIFAAALSAAPASAVTLMDYIPPVVQDEPLPVTNSGGPRGHVVIGDLENTLRGGMVYDHVNGLDTGALPLASDDLAVVPPVANAVVPEPYTWAMMLGGFAVLGGALRRRANRTTASLSH